MSTFESSTRGSHRAVFPCRDQGRISVFWRARILGSGAPSPKSTTLNRSGGRRLTTSFTVRFCAFVFASSANDGVNTVIMKAFVGYALVSPLFNIMRKPLASGCSARHECPEPNRCPRTRSNLLAAHPSLVQLAPIARLRQAPFALSSGRSDSGNPHPGAADPASPGCAVLHSGSSRLSRRQTSHTAGRSSGCRDQTSRTENKVSPRVHTPRQHSIPQSSQTRCDAEAAPKWPQWRSPPTVGHPRSKSGRPARNERSHSRRGATLGPPPARTGAQSHKDLAAVPDTVFQCDPNRVHRARKKIQFGHRVRAIFPWQRNAPPAVHRARSVLPVLHIAGPCNPSPFRPSPDTYRNRLRETIR